MAAPKDAKTKAEPAKDATPANGTPAPKAAEPAKAKPITTSAHERLAAGGFKDGLLRVDPEVQDDELMRDRPLFLLVGAVERKEPMPGSTIAKGMEVWHAMAELSPGKWIARTIRGRSHLSKCLMGQVHAHGLGFVDVRTGAAAHVPGLAGGYAIVSRDTLEPAVIGVFVSIDKTKGKAAMKGNRFTYLVDGNGRTLREALQLLPELPLSEKSVLAIGLDDQEPGDE